MPVMDGMQATKEIRFRGSIFIQDSIVALSADAFTEQQQKAISIGVNEYITKPIDFAKLKPVLDKYLLKVEGLTDSGSIERKSFDAEAKEGLKLLVDELASIEIFMTDQLMQKFSEIQQHLKHYDHPHGKVLNTIKKAIYAGDEVFEGYPGEVSNG